MTTTPTSGAADLRATFSEMLVDLPNTEPYTLFKAGFDAALAAGQATAAQAVAEPADTVVLNAAMRAIQQAIGLIGDPADERMQAVRRVLRGAVVVAEDSGDIPAQPASKEQPRD